eukprot:Hpha_TRINITY_DN15987_c2_g4::TRINITY_DN15987_c2_g4_i1::g.72305::m.72305/K13750/SLC24A2, NCKX2; solute carrier family 24 (sodium/potassium/calcium exchanger), member 2
MARTRRRSTRLAYVPISAALLLLVGSFATWGSSQGPPKRDVVQEKAVEEKAVEEKTGVGRALLQVPSQSPTSPTVSPSVPPTDITQLIPSPTVQPSVKEEDPLYPDDLFSADQLEKGAIILHVIGIFYMFWGLAIICDDYFVPALEVITETLQLSEDVAGATFMAAGGSAPELFTSLFGVFVAKSNVGFGTIVGSAVFNVLFVIGACAAFTRKLAGDQAKHHFEKTGELIPWYHQGLELTAWPLARDSIFYGIDLVVLLICFLDEKIYWYEALILLFCYSCYVIFMKFNEPLHDFVMDKLKANTKVHAADEQPPSRPPEAGRRRSTLKAVAREIIKENRRQSLGASAQPTPKQESPEDEEEEDDDGPWDPKSFPESAGDKVKFILGFPLNFPMWCTVPNCVKDEMKKYYVIAFVLSIVWIAIFSYFMVWWADTLGVTAGIPPEVMGLTLLAAGTSVPDLITSVVVAMNGKGDMAVSSSIGSNIFDITFGLPLPWFLYCAIMNGFDEPINVTSNSLGSSVIMLFCMLIATIICIVLFQWKLNVALGGTSLILYCIFMTFTLLIEYEKIDGINI